MKNKNNTKKKTLIGNVVLLSLICATKVAMAWDPIEIILEESEKYERQEPVTPYEVLEKPAYIEHTPREEQPVYVPNVPVTPCCQDQPQAPQPQDPQPVNPPAVPPTVTEQPQNEIPKGPVAQAPQEESSEPIQEITNAMSGGGCSLLVTRGNSGLNLAAILLALPSIFFFRRKRA